MLKANVYLNGEFFSFALNRYLVYAWWRAPEAYRRRSGAWTWSVHAFFLFLIVNGTVVFVPWPRRALGLALLALCALAVRHRARATGSA